MKILSILISSTLLSAPLTAGAHEGGHDTRGVVTSVDEQELKVKTTHGTEKFALTPKTEFLNGTSQATANDIKVSDRVVVHATKKAGRLEAVKVQFKSTPNPKK